MRSRSNGLPAGLPWRPEGRPARQVGFTLIEVLVAFVIASIGLAVLFQAFSVGLKTEERVGDGWAALRLAQSKLASVGPVLAVRSGFTNGVTDRGLAWDVEVVPLPAAAGTDAHPRLPVLARVTVRVRAHEGGNPLIELHSLRPIDGS